MRPLLASPVSGLNRWAHYASTRRQLRAHAFKAFLDEIDGPRCASRRAHYAAMRLCYATLCVSSVSGLHIDVPTMRLLGAHMRPLAYYVFVRSKIDGHTMWPMCPLVPTLFLNRFGRALCTDYVFKPF